MSYDVAIVGASVAGCTAAISYGRAGLRVALVERNPSMQAHKALCGHFILGGTRPTLERLGLWRAMIDAGASTSYPGVWSDAGWVEPRADVPPAISLRRRVLDPMLRQAAADTPGVDLFLGHAVAEVATDGRRVAGVVATTADGSSTEVRARLVVAADGHRSRVSELANVPTKSSPNARFLYWAYYRNLELRGPGSANVWFVDPHVAVATPTDDGLTLVGVFGTKELLPEFVEDRIGALERFVAKLPDGPDLARAERASKVIGTSDYPILRRDPVPRPGLALVGDAATAADPVPAVGCGWAFRSAEWLADATIPSLCGEHRLRSGLRAYRRAHRFIDRHCRLITADARGLPPNKLQRALRAAAVRDDDIAARLGRFLMRTSPVSDLLNPRVAVRALRLAR